MEVIRELAGHADIRTTMIYRQVNERRLEHAVSNAVAHRRGIGRLAQGRAASADPRPARSAGVSLDEPRDVAGRQRHGRLARPREREQQMRGRGSRPTPHPGRDRVERLLLERDRAGAPALGVGPARRRPRIATAGTTARGRSTPTP